MRKGALQIGANHLPRYPPTSNESNVTFHASNVNIQRGRRPSQDSIFMARGLSKVMAPPSTLSFSHQHQPVVRQTDAFGQARFPLRMPSHQVTEVREVGALGANESCDLQSFGQGEMAVMGLGTKGVEHQHLQALQLRQRFV